jgi:O-antigen/teichoic acid export membrane protein
MVTLFFQVDQVLLEYLRGAEEVAYYAAPVLVLEGLTLVPRVLAFALLPTMAELAARAPGPLSVLYRRATKYLLVAGLPVAAFGVLAAEPFVTLLFGERYAPSVPLARILLPAAALMFLSNLGETVLACTGRWRTIVIVSTLAAAVNIALNLAWIPAYGAAGAAWATLLTEAGYFLGTVYPLSRAGHSISWPRTLARPLAATAVFCGALLVIPATWPVWVSWPMAAVAFIAATWACRVWDQKEYALLRGLVHGTPPEVDSLTS